MKQKMLLVLAVFFGFLAFILSYAQLNAEKKKILGEAETVYVIQLKRDKAANEEILLSDIARKEIKRMRDSDLNTREIPWSQAMNVVGRHLEASMRKGQLLQDTDLKLVTQRHGFTTHVRKGYRAVSIPVDATSSVNNLIQPQDNVDVIGTFRFPDLKGDSALDTVTMTILQNVKVLAVGRRYGMYAADPQGSSRNSYNTVTLMLLPHEVEMVVFASQKGRLSLSLRNYSETEIISETPSIDFRKLEKDLPRYNKIRERNQKGF